jgi:hypothetical protein
MRDGKYFEQNQNQNAAEYSNRQIVKQGLDSVEEQLHCGRTQEALVK